MLLRSSSTPILGSLLFSSSPFLSESPTNKGSHHHQHQHSLERSSSSSIFPYEFAHHTNPFIRCRFSPLSDSSDRDPSSFGFRRTHSDGNLKQFLPDDSHHHHLPVKSSPFGRRTKPVLETIPSFSMYNSKGQEEEPQEDEEEEEGGDGLTRSVTIGDIIAAEFGYSIGNKNVCLNGNSRENGKVGGKAVPPLYLARGLGIDRLGSGIINAGGGGGGGGKFAVRTGNGGEQFDMETYYKLMVDENPTDALFLGNYARFLYQTKGDPQRAEEYYSRAILADPSDGEILSQYAKLLWEQHHDEERASTYFEQAVQATPHDCHVLAAYAGFLWEKEDNGIEGGPSQNDSGASINHGALAPATI